MEHRWMKYRIFLFFACYVLNSYAQVCEPPEPAWMKGEKILKDEDNSFFAYGIGHGPTIAVARRNAELDGTKNIRMQLGTEFAEQPIEGDSIIGITKRDTYYIGKGQPYSIEIGDEITVYLLYKATLSRPISVDEIPTDPDFNRRREEYYEYLKTKKLSPSVDSTLPPAKPSIWIPIGLNQFGSEHTFDKVRGGVYVAGTLGGAIATYCLGNKWSTHSKNAANYKNRSSMQDQAIYESYRNKRDRYRTKFWTSLSLTVVVPYGINILDNAFLLNKPNRKKPNAKKRSEKNANEQSLILYPFMNQDGNGILLTYNF